MTDWHSRLVGIRHARWLVTGVAGFIGSNLLEYLLKADQHVIGLDNFATGHRRNLDEVRESVAAEQWERFRFIEGDIRDLETCRQVCTDVDYVLHQAALGSVPRSLDDPIATHSVNLSGFLNMLVAARDAQVPRFVFAASSSTYGDSQALPKVEDTIGRPLSPYAVTKYANELYADVFARQWKMEIIGLRYFNVFGPRQDPEGAYAAVIPAWISQMIRGEPVYINGDGETSRDFCFVHNIIQANMLAATTSEPRALGQVYNVAVGGCTTLRELYAYLRAGLVGQFPHLEGAKPIFRDFRAGDVRHSIASIDKAASLLGYRPTHTVVDGLQESMAWYTSHLAPNVFSTIAAR